MLFILLTFIYTNTSQFWNNIGAVLVRDSLPSLLIKTAQASRGQRLSESFSQIALIA